jgi:hypothetical protein
MASLPVRPRSFGIPVPTIAAGWALVDNRRAPGSLTAFLWMGLRPTARSSAIGTFARSTRARQANRFAERPEFCDQHARDRGSAETVPSSSRRALPGRLQFTKSVHFLSNH